MGRPKKYTDPSVMGKKIQTYFEKCKEQERPLTMSGLAVALDMDRQSLINYSKDREFFGTIKKARDIVEAYAEEQLFLSRGVTGVIFNLVNNFGWHNTSDIRAQLSSGDKPFDVNIKVVE